MTEIWKNRFSKNVDIYKRNFLYNLAKNGHIDVRITVLSS
uniref:RE29470p n=1 Tax=Drosophila melanogaster TaxID=7227 RepID=Q8SYX6_DROME|nr:RE29470p [Drosophila melanogaster]